MDIYDVGTVQHYSMWLTCKTNHNCNMKTEQILYCDAIYYVRRLWFNKNHELESYTIYHSKQCCGSRIRIRIDLAVPDPDPHW